MTQSDGLCPAWFDRWATLKGVAALFIAYGFVHGVITSLGGPSLALDDVKLNVVTQSLQGGYLLENPPLFEWLLLSVQQIIGPNIFSFSIVKYGLLLAAGVFTFQTAEDLFENRLWASLTAISLLLLYQVGWNYHQAFTHTAALIAATAFFWRRVLRVMKAPTVFNYGWLGAAIGLGLLAKYSFAAVIVVAFAALLARPEGRRVVLRWPFLITIAGAFIVAAPHMAWLMAENQTLNETVSARLIGDAPYILRLASGLPSALWAVFAFFLPIVPVAILAFGRASLAGMPTDKLSPLFRDATLVGVAGIFVAVVLAGMADVPERYAIPLLFPALFLIMEMARSSAPAPRNIARFVSLCFGVSFLVIAIRIVQAAFPGAPFCSDCRQWIAYGALEQALQEEDLAEATLVGFEDHTAGNLRRFFPGNRVISSHMPFYTPPGGRLGAPCYFIWSEALAEAPPERLTAQLAASDLQQVTGQWVHPLKPRGWRSTQWTIADLGAHPDIRRELCRPQLP